MAATRTGWRSSRRSSRRGATTGLTLIEVLAVAVIIGVLASMVMFAVADARQQAQVAKTKGIIVALDGIIGRHWRNYETRRVPVQAAANLTGEQLAKLRLDALRQVMRLELPDRWADVTTDPAALTNANGAMARPGISQAYLAYHNSFTPSPVFENAECLYMIVTVGLGGGDELPRSILENSVGDLDEDGAPEFLDAWNRPIRFLRWPIGFVTNSNHDDAVGNDAFMGSLSDIMPPIVASGGKCWPNTVEFHDPFDVMRVDEIAFRTYPLIYSAGPDKIFDIYSGEGNPTDTPHFEYGSVGAEFDERPDCESYDILAKQESGGTWPTNAAPRFLGIPKNLNSWNGGREDANDELNHYDNVHNHRLNE
ncbi:MAG: type II secretion system protein [Planctomycetota bacterium]|nr:MAG: type II secretion system protein [Planctomycetota bacterium]REK45927.1 MAG: type II secretion system protein [Planctomycetota bacterium]